MTIMMSDTLVGRLDTASIIASEFDDFVVNVVVDNKKFLCKIDKFKKSRSEIAVLFSSTPEVVEYFVRQDSEIKISILRGNSKIIEIDNFNSEIEITNLNSPKPNIELSIAVV
jgi:hypothetical protein